MALAAIVGTLGGLALGTSRLLERAISIPIEFLRPLPSVAVGPLLLLFVGSGLKANALTVAYAAVWPILFNVLYGVRSVDRTRLDTARILRWSPLATTRRVRLPSTAPFALTGLRVAASIGLIVTISVELLIGAGEGLGGFILRTSAGGGQLQTTYAATFIGGLLGWSVSSLLQWVQTHRYAWATYVAQS
jgi:NitT/TauT family transport system permease protein